jgi:hypothetical protein
MLSRRAFTAGLLGSTAVATVAAACAKDRPARRIYGTFSNVELTAKLNSAAVYTVHDGPVQAITAVYEGGLPLVPTRDYPTRAQLDHAPILAGCFATCLRLGLVKVGSAPQFPLTCDVTG